MGARKCIRVDDRIWASKAWNSHLTFGQFRRFLRHRSPCTEEIGHLDPCAARAMADETPRSHPDPRVVRLALSRSASTRPPRGRARLPPLDPPRCGPKPIPLIMLKNIGSNWALSAVQILVFAVIVPFTLSALGPQRTGVWEFIVSSSGPLQLLALGMPMATVRHVSAAVAAGDTREAERVVGNSLTLSILLCAVALLVGAAIFGGLNETIITSGRWDLSPAEQLDAQRGLVGVLILIGTSFALRLPYAIYDAHHDFVIRNVVQGSGFLLRLVLTVALLTWNASLTVLAAIALTVAVAECIAAVWISSIRHKPLRIRPQRVQKDMFQKLISFGIFAFLMNMGALLAFQIDAIVIGFHMQPDDVTNYAYGNKIFEQFLALILAIGMVAMPMASDMYAKKNAAGLRDVYLKWSKIAATIVLLMGGYLLVLGPEFLSVWFQDDYHPAMGEVMQILMISFLMFLPMRGVVLPVLMGMGRTRGPGFGLLAMGLLNLGLSLVLVRTHGIHGVALGTAIPNGIFAVVFLVIGAKELQVPVGQFCRYVVWKPLLGTLPGLALLAWFKWGLEITAPLAVIGAGVIYTALFGLIQVFYVYRRDPLTDPLALIQAKRASS